MNKGYVRNAPCSIHARMQYACSRQPCCERCSYVLPGQAGQTEVVILRKLSGADPEGKRHCVRLLRTFDYRQHLCLVFENMVPLRLSVCALPPTARLDWPLPLPVPVSLRARLSCGWCGAVPVLGEAAVHPGCAAVTLRTASAVLVLTHEFERSRPWTRVLPAACALGTVCHTRYRAGLPFDTCRTSTCAS